MLVLQTGQGMTLSKHLKCSLNFPMILTILGGNTYALKILQRLSRLTLSNAFSKS